MKHLLLLLSLVLLAPLGAIAAPPGRASADFDNSRPDKSETAWGRLVSDSLRSAAHTDLAVVNAGVLTRGVLPRGAVDEAAIEALLAYPDDEVVVLHITGAQLRAALERAVQAYPTASPAMLHLSGLSAMFNTQAPLNRRITMVRVHGEEAKDSNLYSVAMPASLAEGGAGYYTIWNSRGSTRTGLGLTAAVLSFVRAAGTVSPDQAPRLAAQ